MSALLVLIVALPAFAGAGCALAGTEQAPMLARVSALAAAAAFLLAVVLAIDVALHGSVSAVLTDDQGRQVIGLYANRVTAVLLLLVCGVSAVVQAFARGYLQGDLRAGRFFAWASVLAAATAAMVSAASIVGLGVAWSLAGVALCLLLNMYSGLPAARQGVRRAALSFAIGDGALWSAIVLAVIEWGNLDLRHLAGQAPSLNTRPGLVAVFSCLVLIAALARSAQIPLQNWLPATLAAPTPVSALLHAGVINAGGVLLVRLSPLVGRSGTASTLAFSFGAASVLYGTVLMLTKPDVKGALAHSTIGQMGFMIMTCGLGAYAAAVFHLVAHGVYKATLFLGSGGAVHQRVRHSKSPPRPVGGSRTSDTLSMLLAALLAAAAVLGTWSVLRPTDGSGALLVFVWATATAAARSLLRRRPKPAIALLGLASLFGGTLAYVAWLRTFTGFLSLDLSKAGAHPASPWLVGGLVLALTLAALLRFSGARLRGAHDAVYVLALSAGHVMLAGEARPRRRPRRRAGAWTLLAPGAETAR